MTVRVTINQELQEKVNQLANEVMERITRDIMMGAMVDLFTMASSKEGSYSVAKTQSESYASIAWEHATGPCCGPSRARLFGVDRARPGRDSTVFSWHPMRLARPKEKIEYSDIKIGYSFATIEYKTPIPAKYLEIEGECVEIVD